MTVSVIIPIYKVEKYLEQCVDSVINQTYKQLEIILVDDGSPDACPSICDGYAERDGRIKVIHKQNGGLIAARKSGVEIATGDYITFVDGDDWIAPDMYEKVAAAIQQYQADCVITQFYFAYEDHNTSSCYLLDKAYYDRTAMERDIFPTMLYAGKWYQFGVFPNCWTKIFKADIIRKHIFEVDDRIRLGEDIAFTYPCLMDCQSIAFVDEPLYYYRQNSNSMTASYDPRFPEIYAIPYYSIRNKCYKNSYDFSIQLSYYLFYLTNFYLRNEAAPAARRTVKDICSSMTKLLQNEDVVNCCRIINTKSLPVHSKMIAAFVRHKMKIALLVYIFFFRIFLKLKG